MAKQKSSLIAFPKPKAAEVRPGRGGGSRFGRPDHVSQVKRISNDIEKIEEDLKRKRALLRSDVTGEEPSAILVLEVAGGLIDDFYKAVQKIDMEWLGELDLESLAELDGFEKQDDDGNTDPDGKSPRRMYLTMADSIGLQKFFRMWKRFVDGQNWPRGETSWRNVFSTLKEVRFWNTDDRLKSTGVLDVWQSDLRFNENQEIRCSIEFWFRKNAEKRVSAEAIVRKRVTESGGQVVCDPVVIPEIRYHAMEVTLPRSEVEKVLAGSATDIDLMLADEIMLFNGCGQGFVAPTREPAKREFGWPEPGKLDKPVAALLDGVPAQNHKALEGRIEVEDVNDLEPLTLVSDRAHGTSMASLIAHGDCNAKSMPIGSKILACPILVASTHDSSTEVFPSERNHIEVVKSTVEHVVKNHPQVKVFNLSVGDDGRPFLNNISPLARLLDWLSYRFNILFIVSAGNVGNTFRLDISRGELKKRDPETLRGAALRAIRDNAHNNRLLSPAESINSLTVGALSSDHSKVGYLRDGHYELLGNPGIPALYSAVGSGYRGAAKPDMMLPGGKLLYQDFQPHWDDEKKPDIRKVESPHAPGQLVACPESSNSAIQSRGTSNSTALASRLAVQLQDELSELRSGLDPSDDICDETYTATILKAMLVHSNRWRNSGYKQFQEILGDSVGNQTRRREIGRYMGIGEPHFKRLINNSNRKATLIGVGTL
ncbi:MAG: S8 family peptidase, partial [Planctomycetota bacterium]